jgi:hypothetical protein
MERVGVTRVEVTRVPAFSIHAAYGVEKGALGMLDSPVNQ